MLRSHRAAASRAQGVEGKERKREAIRDVRGRRSGKGRGGRESLTGLRLGGAGRLLLVVFLEARNEIGLVAGVRKTPFAQQLLELGHLHGTVVGHDM